MAGHKRGRCNSCEKDQWRCDGCEEIGCATEDCPRRLWDYQGSFFKSLHCVGCGRER